MNKYLMIALLTLALNAQANENISYSYLELGYEYLDLDGNSNADGFYLDGAFDLTERFYLGGYYNNLDTNGSDIDRFGAVVGFHTNGNGSTDFYSQLEFGQIDTRFTDSPTYGLTLGSRSAINEKFELITRAGYVEIEDANDGYFEAGVKGLFKFTESLALSAEVESLDGEFGASLGFRFIF